MPTETDEKLIFDDNFNPYEVLDGDEIFRNGIFEFNISRMIDYIHSNGFIFSIEKVSVDDFPHEFSAIDETYMDNVQINEPVILAEISPGQFNLIDGNHRMEKARRLGFEYIQAYIITVEHHIKFLTSKKAYKAYVEYWNGKL